MKKILVCGSAGFIASNLIRYMLYRSKDFEFVSVDNLASPKDFKRVYLHRKHKFYIGDITDKYFMERLIYIEKPDYIVNAISGRALWKLNSIDLLGKLYIPTLQLTYPSDIDSLGIYNYINNLASQYGLNILEFPNCFGLRQRSSEGIAKMIKDVIGPANTIYSHDKKWPWVYAEDVASLIWFIIENNIHGTIQMPALGSASLKDISEIVLTHFTEYKPKVIYGTESAESYDNKFWKTICLTYNELEHKSKIEGWTPDSNNLILAIDKTVRWYKANRWAIDV